MLSHAARARRAAPRKIVSDELEQDLRTNRIVVPSKADPWFGRWPEGSELTEEQVNGLRDLGLDPATAQIMDVFLRCTDKQLWIPLGGTMPWRRIRCPVVGTRASGFLIVLAPIGDKKIVTAEGKILPGKVW